MPDNPQKRLEQVKNSTENSPSKVDELKRLKSDFPDFQKDEISRLLVETAYNAGDYQQAFETASNFIAEDKYDFTICYLGGLSCLELDKPREAQTWLEKILFDSRGLEEQFKAWVSLGKVFARQSKWERAIECYEKALELKKDEENFTKLLEISFNAGKYEKILNDINNCNTSTFEIKAWQVKAFTSLKRFDEAFQVIDRLTAELTGDEQKKLEKLRRDTQKDNDRYQIEVQIAKRHIEEGLRYEYDRNLEKSVEAYQKAIELNPRDPLPYYNIGVIYSKLDKKKEMLEAYQQALSLNPDYEKVWYNLGCYYGQLKQREKAIECYDRAIEIDPGYTYAIFNKAYEYEGLENYQKAIECYKQYIELEHDDPSAYFNIAWNYKKLKKNSEAIRFYILTIKVDPSYAKAYNNLGVIFEEIGELRKARAFYKKALDLDSEYALAKRNLETLASKLPEGKHPEDDIRAENYLIGEEIYNLGIPAASKSSVFYSFQNSKPVQKSAEFCDFEKLLKKGVESMERDDTISLTEIAHILQISLQESRELLERLLEEKKVSLEKRPDIQDQYVKI
ncbi:MAG: tetratricopeptide repeat protein [Candidatus Odinarchaeota archaeon]